MSISVAQAILAFVGTLLSAATYALMRFPRSRRAQFRKFAAFSPAASLLGAAAMLALTAIFVFAQRASESR